jgi:hypothetical protein
MQNIRFEGVMAVRFQIVVLWVVTPLYCIVVNVSEQHAVLISIVEVNMESSCLSETLAVATHKTIRCQTMKTTITKPCRTFYTR